MSQYFIIIFYFCYGIFVFIKVSYGGYFVFLRVVVVIAVFVVLLEMQSLMFSFGYAKLEFIF